MIRIAHPRPATLVLLTLLLVLVQGCSLWPFGKDKDKNGEEEDADTTEQVLYRNAQRYLRTANYDIAIKNLERLEARFPFGRYAEQAQLELIYARHMSMDHDAARAAADRFIRLHPNHSNIDYAYYLKGMASYNKNSSLLDRFISTDPSKRDMTSAQEAYADFAQLLARYPTSKYVPDARQRMIYLRNLLGEAELGVADYYLRRGAYMAAANRARYVLEHYDRSDAVPDALIILVECNWRLGLEEAANDALRVLAQNYPNHEAFDADGNLVLANRVLSRDRSWTNIVSLGLLDRPEVPPPITLKLPEGSAPPHRNDNPPASGDGNESPRKKRGWFSWLPFVS
ncbi:MAG: outer membrane protein assembly factor BamD [Pseudomonadales bacterium]